MANAQWEDGKFKGAVSAKAELMHNDKEQRLQHNHSNDKINKEMTPQNYSYYELSYDEKCDKYDKAVQKAAEGVRISSGKNANVTMQGIVIYPPEDLQGEDLKEWFMKIGDMAEDRWGKNFIELDVHVDEQHKYIDPDTGEEVMSKIHGHLAVVPTDDNGKLNGMKFSARWKIRKWNSDVEKMTNEEFGCKWNSGKVKKRKSKTVEELKAESERAAVSKGANQIMAKANSMLADAERKVKAQEQMREKTSNEVALWVSRKRNEILTQEYEVQQRENIVAVRESKCKARETQIKADTARLKREADNYKQEAVKALKTEYTALKSELEEEEEALKKKRDYLQKRQAEIEKDEIENKERQEKLAANLAKIKEIEIAQAKIIQLGLQEAEREARHAKRVNDVSKYDDLARQYKAIHSLDRSMDFSL